MDTKYYFTGTTIVTGFYNTEDHEVIPTGATECTVEERDAACEAQQLSGKILCITGGKIDPQTPPMIPADWDGTKWVYNIDAIRAAKLRDISAAYIAERTTTNKGIMSATLSEIIDCRESDVINIFNLVTLLEAQGATVYFYKIKDNTDVVCSVAEIKAVLAELIAALLSMWTMKQELIAQVNAATTAEDIQAIKWTWAQN